MLHLRPTGLLLPPGVAVAQALAPDPAALSADECVQHDAFASADRRHAFVLGRTAARHLLAEATGAAAAHIELTVGDDGAPRTPGRAVSIAHTGRGADLVAVAAVARRPVGIDVERVGPRRADLWQRLLTPGEHAVLDRLGGPTDSVQTLLWALKESVLKGQRTGFRAGARSVVLALAETPGSARAVSDVSGAWEIAYAPLGTAWLAVAWQDRP